MIKEGRVEYNLKKTKWAQRVLSLNESRLVCHEVTAITVETLNDGVVRTCNAARSLCSVCNADTSVHCSWPP